MESIKDRRAPFGHIVVGGKTLRVDIIGDGKFKE